jgi:hypothetical protein
MSGRYVAAANARRLSFHEALSNWVVDIYGEGWSPAKKNA